MTHNPVGDVAELVGRLRKAVARAKEEQVWRRRNALDSAFAEMAEYRLAEAADALEAPSSPTWSSDMDAAPRDGVTDAQVDAALAYWCSKLPKALREQPIPDKLREHMRATLEAVLLPAAPTPPETK